MKLSSNADAFFNSYDVCVCYVDLVQFPDICLRNEFIKTFITQFQIDIWEIETSKVTMTLK